MEEKIMKEIINDTNKITELIQILNNNFTDIYYELFIKKLLALKVENIKYELINKDAISYYTTGECDAYATILCEIFGEYATKYNSSNHVVTKIGNHFYDAHGIVDNYVKKDFHVTEIGDLYYIDLAFGKKDSLSKSIEEKLIKIGKDVLDKYKEYEKSKIYTKL